MNHWTRSSLAVIGTLLAFAAGCAAPNDTAEPADEEQQVVDSELSSSSGGVGGIGGGSGSTAANIDVPAPTACNGNIITRRDQQAKATRALKYALGGTSNPATGSFGLALNSLRSKMASGRMNIFPGVAATVCGIKAVKFKLVALDLTYTEATQLAQFASLSDDAWGTGASRFIFVDGASVVKDPTNNTYMFSTWIDPEPAKLTQNLSGSTGATAAAIYTNSEAATNVIKWSSTAAAGSPAGGTPCSPGDLSVSSETLKVIQVLPNAYRKCL
jgi:hypothetical protein